MQFHTYGDVFNYLLNTESLELKELLKDKDRQWVGRVQEALLNIFAYLKLIDGYTDMEYSGGNYSKGKFKKISPSELFSLKWIRGDDKSDLTLVSEDTVLAFTSKGGNKIRLDDLEIQNIESDHKKRWKTYKLKVGILVPDKEVLRTTLERSRSTVKETVKECFDSGLVYDHNDLLIMFRKFKEQFTVKNWKELLDVSSKRMDLRFHQRYIVEKALNRLQNTNTISISAVARSGKTYMVLGLIERFGNKHNYVLLTTVPNETIDQYLKILDCYNFRNFDVYHLCNRNIQLASNVFKINKDAKLRNKKGNIIIVSTQYLKNKSKPVVWLKNLNCEIGFIDESHNGGTTELATGVMDLYMKNKRVHVTYTDLKPRVTYGISQEDRMVWDTYDNRICAKDTRREELIQRYPNDEKLIDQILEKYTEPDFEVYRKLPELVLVTPMFSTRKLEELRSLHFDYNSPGFNPRSAFMLAHNENTVYDKFENEEEIKKQTDLLCQCIDRTDRLAKRNGSRRFSTNNPGIIMIYLPIGNKSQIEKLSSTYKNFLGKCTYFKKYKICVINTDNNRQKKNGGVKNPIDVINNNYEQVKRDKKKGLIVLTGLQCSMGVSLPKCDIVVLMNNTSSIDRIVQMHYRCMTEDIGKKYGYVIDMNLSRVCSVVVDLAHKETKEGMNTADAIEKYVLKQNILNVCIDTDFSVENRKDEINKVLSKLISNVYYSDPDSITQEINKTRLQLNISEEIEETLYTYLKGAKVSPSKRTVKSSVSSEPKLGSGIIKIKDEESDGHESTKKKNNNVIDFCNDVLRHMIPLMCILTLRTKDYTIKGIFRKCCEDETLKSILLSQLKIWWGKELPKKFLSTFIKLFEMNDVDELDRLVHNIKNILETNMHSMQSLSASIDKYLIPQELEKKSNAEVSTPYNLRNEMLDTLPKSFWTRPRKVFEPACGKGGFLIDIISRFMIGLQERYKTPKKRYRIIVEKCLYWADINPVNVFICKLLLDPDSKYKLNYHQGDTLEFDTTKWNIDEFDLVVGNPPYATNPSLQNTKPIYNLFIEKFIDCCRYMLFVTPSRWFSGGKGLLKFRNMMKQRGDIKCIKHTDNAKDWFSNVEIKGGVSYFLKDSKFKGMCKFNGKKTDLNEYDIIMKPQYKHIVDQLQHYDKISDIYMNAGYYKIRTNDKRLKDKGKIPVLVSSLKSKNRLMYMDSHDKHKDRTWKVVTCRASGKGGDGFSYMRISKSNELYTDSYVGFRASSKKEAKSIMSYLNCKLPNYMLSIRKISQDINTDTCKWIPRVPFDRIWDDQQVYDYFELDKKSQKIIENTVSRQ